MKVIFLDIDGVLNDSNSNARCMGYIGIDDKKVRLLSKIVYETGACIVLTSSWKMHWQKFDKEDQHEMGNYLDRKLKRQGLHVLTKTTEYGSQRGREITEFIYKYNIEKWIVLDDDIFEDYENLGILPRLIKTSFYGGGLMEEHVKPAIELLSE